MENGGGEEVGEGGESVRGDEGQTKGMGVRRRDRNEKIILYGTDHSHGVMKFSSKPMYHWTKRNLENKKKFLERFARKRGLDPLLPDTWYSFSKKFFDAEKVKEIK